MGPFEQAWQILKDMMAERPMQPMPAPGYFDRGRKNAELFNQADIATQHKLMRDRPEAFGGAHYANQYGDKRNLNPPSKDPSIAQPMAMRTMVPDTGGIDVSNYTNQAVNTHLSNQLGLPNDMFNYEGMGQLDPQQINQFVQQ
tara:strand:+ start:571 stop:999 length:429 start_codon:yes stop_codon:yes gene_type:complete